MQSSLLVLIWILSWCGLGAYHACHDKAKFTENGLHMRLLLRFRYWRFCRFIRAEDFSLPFICKISFTCFIFTRLAFVVLFQQNWFHVIWTSFAKHISFPVCENEFLTFPFWFYNIFLDYDVSLHNLVVLVVMIPTSPRLTKTEFVGESYCSFILGVFSKQDF